MIEPNRQRQSTPVFQQCDLLFLPANPLDKLAAPLGMNAGDNPAQRPIHLPAVEQTLPSRGIFGGKRRRRGEAFRRGQPPLDARIADINYHGGFHDADPTGTSASRSTNARTRFASP